MISAGAIAGAVAGATAASQNSSGEYQLGFLGFISLIGAAMVLLVLAHLFGQWLDVRNSKQERSSH